MTDNNWETLWENDEARFNTYATASPEEKQQMRSEYTNYLDQKYQTGKSAVGELITVEEVPVFKTIVRTRGMGPFPIDDCTTEAAGC
jgi:hypothetical protein